jgi:hypothetical protein
MDDAAAGGASLRTVLDAFAAGAHTLDDVARSTGLDIELVRLAVDQLVTLGLVDAERVGAGCPDGGCGSCAATGSGEVACGSGGGREQGGLVSLTLHRPAPSEPGA